MKITLLFFSFIFLSLLSFAQRNYNEAIQQGDEAQIQGNYTVALEKYYAAEAFEPQNSVVVRQKIKEVFDRIDALRAKAEEERDVAEIKAEIAQSERYNYTGLIYQKKENYDEALKWYRMSAEQGSPAGQNFLGDMYRNGFGVERDYTKAVKWYRISAENGDATAQNNLGEMYEEGYGVTKDYEEAVKWYRMSALQGDANAQKNLGSMYKDGHGVQKDYNEALKLFIESTKQENASGQNQLGYMYYSGFGVTKDYKEAVKWFQLSAEQGNKDGQNNLGFMYRKGYGVQKNERKAIELFEKSVAQGNLIAQNNLLAPQFYFCLRFGRNYSRISGKNYKTDWKSGFQIGVVYDEYQNKNFYKEFDKSNFSIQISLMFTSLGGQGTEHFLGKSLGAKETVKMNLNYFQFSLNPNYNADWGNKNLYARLGPYLGYALSGKLKIKEVSGETNDEKINFGKRKDMRRWDFGFVGGIGLQSGDFQIGFDLFHGITNLTLNGEYKMRNVGGALTLTCRF